MEIACSDNRIRILQREIEIRKRDLRSKLISLKGAQKENSFLEDIVTDYERYYANIKRSKENEATALSMLVEYMDNITASTQLTKEALSQTKKQQRELMGKIETIRKEIDELEQR